MSTDNVTYMNTATTTTTTLATMVREYKQALNTKRTVAIGSPESKKADATINRLVCAASKIGMVEEFCRQALA